MKVSNVLRAECREMIDTTAQAVDTFPSNNLINARQTLAQYQRKLNADMSTMKILTKKLDDEIYETR